MQHGAEYPPQLVHGGQPVPVVSFLGAGATSTVYGCAMPGRAGLVALKLVRPACAELAHNEEARLTALAGCPGVPNLVGHGLLGNSPFLLLQPRGTPLAADRGLLERKRVALQLGQLVDILCVAHAKGIIHRDIRPDNIMVEVESATLYIIDWCVQVHAAAVQVHARGSVPHAVGQMDPKS